MTSGVQHTHLFSQGVIYSVGSHRAVCIVSLEMVHPGDTEQNCPINHGPQSVQVRGEMDQHFGAQCCSVAMLQRLWTGQITFVLPVDTN